MVKPLTIANRSVTILSLLYIHANTLYFKIRSVFTNIFLFNLSIFYLLKISSWRLGNVDRMDQMSGDVRRRERN